MAEGTIRMQCFALGNETISDRARRGGMRKCFPAGRESVRRELVAGYTVGDVDRDHAVIFGQHGQTEVHGHLGHGK